MQKLALLLVGVWFGSCAVAQNTGAHATPQTQNAAPAGASAKQPTTQRGPGSSAQPSTRNSSTGSGARRGGKGASAKRAAQPVANGSVQIIGSHDGNPPDQATSAALPGVALQHNAMGITAGTPIQVRLSQAVDSGHAHNGDTVRGVLASALGSVPSGAPVMLTIVAAAPAGQVGSGGVLSLQVTSVNGEQLLSQIITAEGKEGQKELPDAAPALGTEATFAPDQPITLPAA